MDGDTERRYTLSNWVCTNICVFIIYINGDFLFKLYTIKYIIKFYNITLNKIMEMYVYNGEPPCSLVKMLQHTHNGETKPLCFFFRYIFTCKFEISQKFYEIVHYSVHLHFYTLFLISLIKCIIKINRKFITSSKNSFRILIEKCFLFCIYYIGGASVQETERDS